MIPQLAALIDGKIKRFSGSENNPLGGGNHPLW